MPQNGSGTWPGEDEWTGLRSGMENKQQKLSARERTPRIEDNLSLSNASDMEEDGRAEEDYILDDWDQEHEENLYQQIRQLRNEIKSYPNTSFQNFNLDTERKALQEQLQQLESRFSP